MLRARKQTGRHRAALAITVGTGRRARAAPRLGKKYNPAKLIAPTCNSGAAEMPPNQIKDAL